MQITRKDYIARINRVIDFIDENLDQELTLEKLAAVANFSPYHFHRIFSAMVGETLFQFIQRARLQKACKKLIESQSMTVTEIAYSCGFSSPSAFARAFKEFYGCSASEYREAKNVSKSNLSESNSNLCILNSNKRKAILEDSFYFSSVFNNNFQNTIWSLKMKNSEIQTNVEVKELPEMHFAYVRNIGPYKNNPKLFETLFGKIFAWAGPRGLFQVPETKMLAVYHDDPSMTDESKLRISVGITVAPDTKVEGEIGKMIIPSGKYALAHFEIGINQYEEAWNLVYGGWLPESGYETDDRPCFEMYLNDPKTHPQNKHILNICVPVKPME